VGQAGRESPEEGTEERALERLEEWAVERVGDGTPTRLVRAVREAVQGRELLSGV
jgi:hypothetical protein